MLRKIAAAFAVIAACFAVSRGAQAQSVVPGSGLPLASPSPSDVLFGLHGGTLGVGGTTSKFLQSQIVAHLRSGKCNLTGDFGAYGDDTHDDSPALNAALAAWQAGVCGTIVLDHAKTYLINEAIEPAYSLVSGGWVEPLPVMAYPLRFTSDGAGLNGSLGFFGVTPANSGTFDLRYSGGDGLHPTKIDLRAFGFVEFDHVGIVDNATDDYPFMQSTNTTLSFHDNSVIGDTSKTGTAAAQDFFYEGNSGLWANGDVSASGSTVTIGSGDPPFTSSMVGWYISLSPTYEYSGTPYQCSITSVTSATVVVTTCSGMSLSSAYANYYSIGPEATAAFEGFTPKISHNYFSHIRRVVIYENFANDSVAEDNQIAKDSGCTSTTAIPNCAPFYFDRASSVRVGDVLRDNQVEMVNYPFAVYLGTNVINGHFDISLDDGAVQKMFGGAYVLPSSTSNVLSFHSFQTATTNPLIATSSAASVASGSHTVTPGSMTYITTSTPILIDPDGNNVQEWVTPTATTGTTFTATFAYAHSAGFRITGAAPQIAGGGALAAASNTVLSSSSLPNNPTLLPGSLVLGTNSTTPISLNGPLTLNTPLTSTAGNPLTLNTISGAGQAVFFNYNNGATGGISIYNGGTASPVTLSSGGLSYPSASSYNPYNMVVTGNAQFQTPGCSTTVPCKSSFSITLSSGVGSETFSVPSGANCTATLYQSPRLSSSNFITPWTAVSGTTLTVNITDLALSASGTYGGYFICL